MPNATRAAQPGPTRMRREIGQIPAVVARVLSEAPHDLRAVAAAVRVARPRFAVIAARGTSDHAANYAQYLMEIHLGLPTGLAKPSITTIYQRPLAGAEGCCWPFRNRARARTSWRSSLPPGQRGR